MLGEGYEGSVSIPRRTFSRFFFDNIHTWLIKIVMISIIGGIIIDKFGELRE